MAPDDEDPVLLVTRAAQFAAERHSVQRRKDAAQTPYINHLIEVAHLLARAGCDPPLIAAGFLHDAVEDAGVTLDQLRAEFGEDIAQLVAFATDNKAEPRHVRKNHQVQHAALADRRQANLKLADKISNLRSIRDSPPGAWSDARIAKYIAWADAVVRRLRGPAPLLAAEYEAVRADLLRLHPQSADVDPVYDPSFAD